jgi:hypothetical protein
VAVSFDLGGDAPTVPVTFGRGGDSPAARTRRHRLPPSALPPEPPPGARTSNLRGLRLTVGGVVYPVGAQVEDDPGMTAGMDEGATLTVGVRDVRGALQRALGDRSDRLPTCTTRVNGVLYALTGVSVDSFNLVSLAFVDEVADRLGRYDSYVSMRRTRTATFAHFAKRLVDEARRPPLARFGLFLPELNDPQEIPDPVVREKTRDRPGRAGRRRGTGADDTGYRVKGALANARQRRVLDELLRTAEDMGASQLVMTGAVMAATQESVMGELTTSSSGLHHGIFHQDASYGSVAQRRDVAHATRGFLDRWRQRNGSVKTVRGDLAAIERVQVSGNPGGYRQWQREAARTVARWLNAGSGGGASGEIVTIEPYEFHRGERHGQPETSWDCLGRYAEERAWHRWAYGNTAWLASDEELRAAAPSLKVDGNEAWLLEDPSYEAAAGRRVAELQFRVHAERWGAQPGAVVLMSTGLHYDGRWLVGSVEGGMAGPEMAVTLRRPAPAKAEPANETSTESVNLTGQGTAAQLRAADSAKEAAQIISRQGLPYAWGGGHPRTGTPSRSIRPGESQVGYDCSGYVCAILGALGHGMRLGQPALSSGALMSWGRPGRGKSYTVWANSEHTWIEFSDGSRADTSPQGCGESGPRYRTCKRTDQARFTGRHWEGF